MGSAIKEWQKYKRIFPLNPDALKFKFRRRKGRKLFRERENLEEENKNEGGRNLWS